MICDVIKRGLLKKIRKLEKVLNQTFIVECRGVVWSIAFFFHICPHNIIPTCVLCRLTYNSRSGGTRAPETVFIIIIIVRVVILILFISPGDGVTHAKKK